MRYFALACDYDGTIAHNGRVDQQTLTALDKLLASGRKLILVTGRELDELISVFPHLDLFERVVAENGGLLYRPANREEKSLGSPPPEPFLQELRTRGVSPFAVGRVIVATWHPYETVVLEAIRDLGLEMQVIFNKDAVMVLPSGINKASGLTAALEELQLSPHNVVAVGDAENDHAFMKLCECSAAVENALPMVKETADIVTSKGHGAGVAELIEEIVSNDLAGVEERLGRHHILLGTTPDGAESCIRPHGTNLLIAGPSGSGKSTTAAGFLERLGAHKYQYCIVDPEGDYEGFDGAITLGNSTQGPNMDEVLRILEKPNENVVVNLVGLAIADRPPFFLQLLPRIQELRSRTGRPHWLIVDETHHLAPTSWEPAAFALPQKPDRMVLITVHPDFVSPPLLSAVDTVVAVGDAPGETLGQFFQATGTPAPTLVPANLESGEAVVWSKSTGALRIKVVPGRIERHRHTRKYAEGELPPDRSFYFQGPDGKLNLRAQNLHLFVQIAEGVDDGTWTYHLNQGDYSRWFLDKIKDKNLSEIATRIQKSDLSPKESRQAIKEAIERFYTVPASPPMPVPGTDWAAAKDAPTKPAVR